MDYFCWINIPFKHSQIVCVLGESWEFNTKDCEMKRELEIFFMEN